MSICLEFFCCCFYPQSTTPASTRNSHDSRGKNKKIKPPIKPSRIISKYKKQQITQVTKEDKRQGARAYTCPICTILFSKILACQACQNNICRDCLEAYEKKYQTSKENMKCPFCASEKSYFIDYEKEAHSYFDTTNQNGFLDASERKKIDEEMKKNHEIQVEASKLQVINEQQPCNLVTLPTNNQIQCAERIQQRSIQRNYLMVQQNEELRNMNEDSNIVMIHRNQDMQEYLDGLEAVSN